MADKEPVSVQEGVDMARNTSKGAEGEERPVREKLKNAAISSQRGSPEASDPDASPDDSKAAPGHGVNGKSRPARKRSLSDLKDTEPGAGSLDAPATPSSGSHQRKKTREQKDEQGNKETRSTDADDDDDDNDNDDDAETPGERHGSSPPSDEALGSREGSVTPPAKPKQNVPPGDESPRKKRSAEDMGEGFAHKQKIPATEVAQIARKSLDENRPKLEPSRNGIPQASQDTNLQGIITSGTSSFGATASTSSPFASFASKPGETKPSAFSQAGIPATASSSPFGAFGSSAKSAMTPSVGGSSTSASGDMSSKLSFANASSAFTAGSAFGGTGGGGAGLGSKLSSFSSPKGDFQSAPIGTRLTTFASPSGGDFKPTTAKLGSFAAPGGGDFGASTQKSRPPFGAPADERSDATGSDEEAEGGEDSVGGGDDAESRADEDAERSQGPKGEEDEETLFSSRAKLYAFTDGAWKERGTGTFKLNIHRDSDLYPQQEDYDDLAKSQSDTSKSENSASNSQAPEAGTKKEAESKGIETTKNTTQARFIMRATATHRVIINAPLFKWMLMGDPRDPNKPPLSKQMVFGVPEEGKMAQYLLRIGREDELKSLYQTVKVIQRKL